MIRISLVRNTNGHSLRWRFSSEAAFVRQDEISSAQQRMSPGSSWSFAWTNRAASAFLAGLARCCAAEFPHWVHVRVFHHRPPYQLTAESGAGRMPRKNTVHGRADEREGICCAGSIRGSFIALPQIPMDLPRVVFLGQCRFCFASRVPIGRRHADNEVILMSEQLISLR